MKKIPTLFERQYADHHVVGINDKVTEGFEWVLAGEGVATLKVDGSCTAIIGGVLYKRYDAKKGKKPPEGAIPCCDPDPVTGHWPHWVKVSQSPADKWYVEAYKNTLGFMNVKTLEDATYEVVGPHFQGNPYKLPQDEMTMHGKTILRDCPRSFAGIRDYLKEHAIEGVVFWKDGIPQCKIKRTDFGFEWPIKEST